MTEEINALVIVDVQNDFCDGGSLAVSGGGSIVPGINKYMSEFDIVVTTQDFHPEGHVSFKNWPEHCVQGSKGVQIHPMLDFDKVDKNFPKGTDKNFDSYSGFFDDNKVSTGLHEYLQEKGVTRVYVCGLALDYCVKFTALDAAKLGYTTIVIDDLCRGIDESNVSEMRLEVSLDKYKFNLSTTNILLIANHENK